MAKSPIQHEWKNENAKIKRWKTEVKTCTYVFIDNNLKQLKRQTKNTSMFDWFYATWPAAAKLQAPAHVRVCECFSYKWDSLKPTLFSKLILIQKSPHCKISKSTHFMYDFELAHICLTTENIENQQQQQQQQNWRNYDRLRFLFYLSFSFWFSAFHLIYIFRFSTRVHSVTRASLACIACMQYKISCAYFLVCVHACVLRIVPIFKLNWVML